MIPRLHVLVDIFLISFLLLSCHAPHRPQTINPPVVSPVISICSGPPGLKVVNVDNERALRAAVRSLKSNTEIRIAPGTYDLKDGLILPERISNVVIRGATGKREDVVLKGKGMTHKEVRSGIWASHVNGLLIADLSIQGTYYHTIILNAGVDNANICNTRLADSGQQIIKSNPGPNGGNRNGIVQHSLMEYTTTSRDDYTSAVDVIWGRDWIIRDNVFRNIRAPEGAGLAGPTILMWKRTRNTIVERNVFLNCQYGIAFGLVEGTPDDHSGGIIRNNFYHRKTSESGDVGIYVADSPDTKVINNTVILNATYPNAIEYRFRNTRRIEISNNLTDANIVSRDGATGKVTSNITSALPEWFANMEEGNLHLTNAAFVVLKAGEPHPEVVDDIDGQIRPQNSNPDIGADQHP